MFVLLGILTTFSDLLSRTSTVSLFYLDLLMNNCYWTGLRSIEVGFLEDFGIRALKFSS